jgi:hypothetical protein
MSVDSWFQSVIGQLPPHMVDTTLLVAWRAWYARNEVTHDKPLPPIIGSHRFLSGYIKLIGDVKSIPTENLVKGKQPASLVGMAPVPAQRVTPSLKPWTKPPTGWIKLSIDGSYSSGEFAGVGTVVGI